MTPESTTDAPRSPQFGASPVRRIVSAAMLMDDGLIVPGVRHFSMEMRAVLHRIYGDGYHLRVKQQGFVDTHGNFLGREEAWKRANQTGQILRDCGTTGELFSENLY
jgi:hypothetical protein